MILRGYRSRTSTEITITGRRNSVKQPLLKNKIQVAPFSYKTPQTLATSLVPFFKSHNKSIKSNKKTTYKQSNWSAKHTSYLTAFFIFKEGMRMMILTIAVCTTTTVSIIAAIYAAGLKAISSHVDEIV